MIANNSSTLIL